eukprot:TRINITY_DN1948_c0_g1_i13.p1 TRINITY_DN1948_c0_g1~~TRINITY_DN1948_c0_g1_i13.p1  ORF type:complete len:612 (+),score=76.06 TRINITY_DN1948_c0_g1_i13:780-2615(+)
MKNHTHTYTRIGWTQKKMSNTKYFVYLVLLLTAYLLVKFAEGGSHGESFVVEAQRKMFLDQIDRMSVEVVNGEIESENDDDVRSEDEAKPPRRGRQKPVVVHAGTRNQSSAWTTGDLYDGKVTIQKEGPWFLGTCTGTKSSGAWIREWIELQLIGGVDHVWIVNDNPEDSDDATSEILKYYVDIGYVTVIPGGMPLTHPGCTLLSGPEGRHNCAPVKHCFEHASPHVKWLLFADTDEFLFPINGCSLRDHIKNHCNPDASHIIVRWERFGSNHFDQHPAGLMLENFLSSGGGCSKTPTFDKIFRRGYCARTPYSFCGECRHTKVIYNTECAGLEHAGWIHWPVNTTDWKNPANGKRSRYHGRVWAQSEGPNSNWKSKKCVYMNQEEDFNSCNNWLRKGGGSFEQRVYNEDCCAAGLGYNHYGMKSRQYYESKKATKAESKRGFRAKAELIDLNSSLSFSVLRFLRVLRRRFRQLGLPVSDNVAFVDAKGAKSASCFVEKNFRYTESADTVTIQQTIEAIDESECCARCFAQPRCRAFTMSREDSTPTCVLLIANPTVLNAPKTPAQPYHLLADREWNMDYTSGIPLREGECRLSPVPSAIPLVNVPAILEG